MGDIVEFQKQQTPLLPDESHTCAHCGKGGLMKGAGCSVDGKFFHGDCWYQYENLRLHERIILLKSIIITHMYDRNFEGGTVCRYCRAEISVSSHTVDCIIAKLDGHAY